MEKAILVEVAEVAGLVPPIFEGLGGFFGGVVVAGGDVIAFYQDFALLADLDLDVGQGPASGVGAAFNHGVIADDGRGLGGAIALEDLDSKHLPLAAQVPVKGSAAGHDEVKLAAELLVDRAEEVSTEAERGSLGHLEELLPEPLLALSDHLTLDAVHQQFQGLGHH